MIKLCCLLSPEDVCFDCGKQYCRRHYNWYSKKSGFFRNCSYYGTNPYGFCQNQVCPSCSKELRVRVGTVKCKLHAPDLSASAPKVFRCRVLYIDRNVQKPIAELKKHMETCKEALGKHLVGPLDIYGEHVPALKANL